IEAMAGHFEPAARHLYQVADRADSPGVGAAATFAASLCDRVAGRCDHGHRLEHSIEVLAAIGPPMLGAIGHALAVGDLATVTSLMDGTTDAWDPDENRWLAASRDLALGIAVLARGETGRDAEPLLRQAGDAFGKLGAEVLRSWAQALRALAQVKSQGPTPPAVRAVHDALHLARLTKCPGAELLSLDILVVLEPAHAGAHEATARRLEKEGASPLGGFVSATLAPASWPAGAPSGDSPTSVSTAPSVPAVHASDRRAPTDPGPIKVPPAAVLRCFGGFTLALNGEPVDCATLRPRSRSALRWLALEAGRPVHREALMAGLWPEDDLASATRKLHVTMSSLRQLLDRSGTRQGSSLLVRDGQAYLLDLGPGASVDVAMFAAALGEADQARKIGDAAGAIAALARALDVYRGDLLPEEGPADWVVGHREQLRLRAADGAEALAELRTETGDVTATIAACEQGLRIDRYRDGLWRRLIAALNDNRDHAKAARVSRQYEDVLIELGLGPA
ncbi:MAG TPA: BTAD domain-containing putative transcriptional regulator, partial [Acidimicrobiales bacterium]|nr:BTAD domain-containing putative transcriptional regulator [Acidimicrobiales bacterium]